MSKAVPKQNDSDVIWQTLVAWVMDSRGDWRRKVTDATGLPFSRIRALKRLGAGPMTLKDLADAMSTDAPAATVAINDLESRGLVERYPHPENRRAKLVSLTAAGRSVMATTRRVVEATPPALQDLSATDIKTLRRILDKVAAHQESRAED
ncbi:MarR family transcriptional regulator [Rhodanobacter sp. Root561]|uniref:MarR family winged helix-turn-helix transcriptional regulator n=1 Tax=Rhodanobacter sp. Root561 TaxID=1736560 RepID=UPI000AE97408|nr:MarR family transcriptional regulator [Rhodanobacter sp. Root561]